MAEELLAHAQSRLPPGGRTSVQLIAAEGKEGFYEKLGFRKMPGGRCGFALRRVLHGHPAE
nr:GNAT family N-acetyltransferase [Ruthenibacterium lactatiformans]